MTGSALPSSERMRELLAPFLPAADLPVPDDLFSRLASFLNLLLRWNAHTNLTAVRDPEQIVLRHFGESLFAGMHISGTGSLLDLGSGAGFPGVPIQLLHPALFVTLAEAQGKKAAFLQEAVRTLRLAVRVWSQRAEAFPPETRFDTVALRAVDRMDRAVPLAARLARTQLCILSARTEGEGLRAYAPQFDFKELPLPAAHSRVLLLGVRRPELRSTDFGENVSRGTSA